MRLAELVAVPPGVVAEMGALVAPLGTVAAICVGDLTVNAADAPRSSQRKARIA